MFVVPTTYVKASVNLNNHFVLQMGYKGSQYSHTSLYDRVKKLLVSYEWSDCNFSISGKDFRAHKLILGISSPVFEAMFYGPLSSDDDIKITDIEPEIFQLLLNYIYTDRVEISSIEEAFELLYASKKYLLEPLSEMCIAYIAANISIENVTTILNYPDFMQDKKLISASIKLFCEHASYLLQGNQMLSLPCLKTILDCDEMNIGEKDLIKYVFDWTIQYCEQQGIPQSFMNRRDVLIKNNLLQSLRFLTLSSQDIDDLMTDVNCLLLPDETESIKSFINRSEHTDSKDVDFLGSTQEPRISINLQWSLCHRRPLKSVAPIIINSNNYIVNSRMKASKSVFITSFCIPTRMAPVLNFRNNAVKVYSEQISVSVVCESDSSIIKFTNFMNTVEYDSTVDIHLPEPCFITKDKWYRISFEWPQNRFLTYSYLVECRDRYYDDQKVTFEFEDSTLTSNNVNSGSFLGGLKFCL